MAAFGTVKGEDLFKNSEDADKLMLALIKKPEDLYKKEGLEVDLGDRKIQLKSAVSAAQQTEEAQEKGK